MFTWDLTKDWRFNSRPLATGDITNTVKWASNNMHTQSMTCIQQESKKKKKKAITSDLLTPLFWFAQEDLKYLIQDGWSVAVHLWETICGILQVKKLQVPEEKLIGNKI